MIHKIRRYCFTAVIIASLAFAARAQDRPAAADPLGEGNRLAAMHSISSHTLLDCVKELCAPKYQGRLTGTPGYDASADWVIRLLSDWKIKPGGDQGGYLQRFPNPYTLVLPGAELILHVPLPGDGEIQKPYVLEKDYFPGSTSDSGTVKAEVVYAGYGITAPSMPALRPTWRGCSS